MVSLCERRGRSTAALGFVVCLLANPAAAQTTGDVSPAAAAQFEIRLQQLEQQVRSLTGMVEEMTFHVQRLESQFERSQSDMEMRLQMGESGPASENLPSGGNAVVASPTTTASSEAPVRSSSVVIQNNALASSSAQPVVTAAAPPLPLNLAQPPPANASPNTAVVLPQGAPAEDYNNAYALLQQADYPGAERAFGAFLASHPNDPLAGNAQYWLAETFYVRENYHQAAVHFAEGYKKYPEGPKAAANLLKLGMSLGRLGKNSEACASLDELDRRFPDAPGNVQQYARTERQRLGCG